MGRPLRAGRTIAVRMSPSMNPIDHQRTRLVVAAALNLVLAVWVGGSVAVDAIVVPIGLEALPRMRFVEFGGALFHRLNFVECIFGAVGALLAFSLGRVGWGTRLRHLFATGALFGMTLLVLFFLLYLTPAMLDRVHDLVGMGVDFTNPADMPPERAAFRTFHAVYSALDVAKILTGGAVLWLLATRPGR